MSELYTLFVFDDEDEIRRGIVDTVNWKGWGFNVVGEASDGIEALQKIPGLNPDVVLSDIRMPGMDGIAFMQEIRLHYPETKIVILSGFSDFEYLDMSIKNEVSAYLLKPTDMDDFESTFKALKQKLDKERAEKAEQERKNELLRESPAWIRERLKDSERFDSGNERLVQRAIDYIEKKYISPRMSLQTLAEHLQKNPAYVSKIFKDVTGENYVHYVQKKRLAHAMGLIKDSNLLVYQVAYKSGFSDLSNFIKLFKKEYGLTPSEFSKVKDE
jgi:two-component system response regulator YesN